MSVKFIGYRHSDIRTFANVCSTDIHECLLIGHSQIFIFAPSDHKKWWNTEDRCFIISHNDLKDIQCQHIFTMIGMVVDHIPPPKWHFSPGLGVTIFAWFTLQHVYFHIKSSKRGDRCCVIAFETLKDIAYLLMKHLHCISGSFWTP